MALKLLRGNGGPTPASSPSLRLGDLVRVRPGLLTPTYGWGALTPLCQDNAEVVESARIAPLIGIERVTQARLSGSGATALVQCQPEVCVHGARQTLR